MPGTGPVHVTDCCSQWLGYDRWGNENIHFPHTLPVHAFTFGGKTCLKCNTHYCWLVCCVLLKTGSLSCFLPEVSSSPPHFSLLTMTNRTACFETLQLQRWTVVGFGYLIFTLLFGAIFTGEKFWLLSKISRKSVMFWHCHNSTVSGLVKCDSHSYGIHTVKMPLLGQPPKLTSFFHFPMKMTAIQM